MINKYLVKKKIGKIQEYLQEIEEIISLDFKKILEDFKNLKALERDFQLIVDEMIDINLHFISELNLKNPDDFQSSFEIISDEKKILPRDFALKIAPVTGLRNRLVHRYEEIDKEFFVKQVKKEYKDFKAYIKYVNRFLERIKNN